MSKIVFSKKTGHFSRKTLERIMLITFVSTLVYMSIFLLFSCESFVSFSLQTTAIDQTLRIWICHLECEAVSEESTAVRIAVLASQWLRRITVNEVHFCLRMGTTEEVSNIMKKIVTKEVCGALVLAGSQAPTQLLTLLTLSMTEEQTAQKKMACVSR